MKSATRELNLKVVYFDGITMAVPEDWRIRPGHDRGEWLWHSPDNAQVLSVSSGILKGDFESHISTLSDFLNGLGDSLVSSKMDKLNAGVLFTAIVDHLEGNVPHRTFRWYLAQDMKNGPIALKYIHSVPRALEERERTFLLNNHLDNTMRITWSEELTPQTEAEPPVLSAPTDGRLRLERLYDAVNILIPAHWVTDISDPELAECFDEADTDENLTLNIAVDHFTRPDDETVLDLDQLESMATSTIKTLTDRNSGAPPGNISVNPAERSVDWWREVDSRNENGLFFYRCSRYFLTSNGFAIVNYGVVVDRKVFDDPDTQALVSLLKREIALSTFE